MRREPSTGWFLQPMIRILTSDRHSCPTSPTHSINGVEFLNFIRRCGKLAHPILASYIDPLTRH